MYENELRGLEHLRNNLNKSQVEVADELGINYKTYNHFERKRRRPRDLGTLLKLADYFEVSVEEIIWHLSEATSRTYRSPRRTGPA